MAKTCLLHRRAFVFGGSTAVVAPGFGHGGIPPSEPSEIRALLLRCDAQIAGVHVLIQQALNPGTPIEIVPHLGPANAIYPTNRTRAIERLKLLSVFLEEE